MSLRGDRLVFQVAEAMVSAGQTSGSTGLAVNPTCGHVLSVSGSQAGVGLPDESLDPKSEASITVGKFLRIQRARSTLIGISSTLRLRRKAGETVRPVPSHTSTTSTSARR